MDFPITLRCSQFVFIVRINSTTHRREWEKFFIGSSKAIKTRLRWEKCLIHSIGEVMGEILKINLLSHFIRLLMWRKSEKSFCFAVVIIHPTFHFLPFILLMALRARLKLEDPKIVNILYIDYTKNIEKLPRLSRN